MTASPVRRAEDATSTVRPVIVRSVDVDIRRLAAHKRSLAIATKGR